MCESSLKHFVTSLGSRTSVLNISHPIVSIYTHRHKIENFEIFNFFAVECHHWRGLGFWLQFLVPVGAHTCAWWVLEHVLALFGAFPNTKSILGVMLCFKLHFWQRVKKRVLGPFYPLWRPQNCILGPVDGAFRVPLEPQKCTKMAKKGSQGAGKPKVMSKTLWEYLGNHSPTFEK